jgi:signal transduction histidine kinase
MGAAGAVSRPPRGVEGVLVRLRVPDHVARLLAAAPSLRWSWAAAGAVSVGFSVWAAHTSSDGLLVFLVVAPLLPVGGVAAAYGPWMDPMQELAQAAPLSNLTIVLIRSTAVLATTAAIIGFGTVLLPGADWSAVAWILPALALTVASLALSTFVPVHRAAAAVALLWFVAIVVTESGSPTRFAAFRGPGQIVFFLVVVGSSGVLALRRERLEVRGRARQQRLIDAAEAERRRIERNIHDGAQQQFVAISVKVGLARTLIERDPARAAAMLVEIQAESREALESLREMTRGTYPPILADEGLERALEAKARKAAVPVSVRANGIGRFSKEVETAVYYCCLEALQNVAKYARASQATIELRFVGGALSFTIEDDGVGFELGSAKRGIGLRSMEERVQALGGTLEVRAEPGAGTRVTGQLTAQR